MISVLGELILVKNSKNAKDNENDYHNIWFLYRNPLWANIYQETKKRKNI